MFRARQTIEWEEPVYDVVAVTSPATGTYSRVVRYRKMRCDVSIDFDTSSAAKQMGRRACESKGGKCSDGHVTVKRIGQPIEIA